MSNRVARCWGVATTVVIVGFCSPVHAAEIWVDAAAGGGGDGSMGSPFNDLQQGIDAAQPGDTVHALPGTYGAIRTVTDGGRQSRITVVSEEPRQAIVQTQGTALEIDHDFHTFDGLVFDSMFGDDDGVLGGGSNIEFLDVEIRNATRDCVDLGTSSDILFADSVIHHCVNFFDPDNNADAHGITGNSVFNLTVRDSEIYLVTGDALQLSPGRDPWDNVLVERTTMWSGPIDMTINGWTEGEPIGENAFDTKVGEDLNGSGERPRATFRDVVAYGWRGSITNQGAFTIKEEVDFVLDRATIFDCEIAGRLRGPATVRWQNVVMYDLDIGFRLEDDLPDPAFYNLTFGGEIGTLITDAGGEPVNPSMQNLLFLADAVPPPADTDPSNIAVDGTVFEDAVGHDYRLLMGSTPADAGVAVAGVEEDRLGVPRPFGDAFDIGAYEWTDEAPPPDTDGGSTSGGDESGETGGSASTTSNGGTTSGGGSGGVTSAGGSSGAGGGSGTDAVSGTDSGGDASGDESGCGCRSSGGPGWSAALFLLAIGAVRRRRQT